MNEVAVSVILYVAIVMPANVPDILKKIPMPSLEECFDNARQWDERGVTQEMSAKGAIAVMAGCRVNGKPT